MLLVGWFLPNVSPVTPTVAAGLNPAEPCPVVLNPVLLNLLLLNLLLLNLLLLNLLLLTCSGRTGRNWGASAGPRLAVTTAFVRRRPRASRRAKGPRAAGVSMTGCRDEADRQGADRQELERRGGTRGRAYWS